MIIMSNELCVLGLCNSIPGWILSIAVDRAVCFTVERTGVAGNGLSGGVSQGRGEVTGGGEQLGLADDECLMTMNGMNLFNKWWCLYTISESI